MDAEPSFGLIVRERRQVLGLTQVELAWRVGCAVVTIRKIETDALRPSVQIAERLALALQIPETEQIGFVRLARAMRPLTPIPAPPPALDEIGQADLSGRAIRGYELADRIGSGGFGAVYRAIQNTVGREVAVKIILPQYADHPDFIRRFEAEAQLVAHLEHPHIVPLYDYWREPGVAYLVMRFLRGGSLEERLKSGPVPLELLTPILTQIGAALEAAHQTGIVHRDLKPANILLDQQQNAYLADFGVAKDLNLVEQTQVGAIVGSPAYFSPEQINAESIKQQTDIYSLGVMLYELLTGQKPFPGPSPLAYIQQHLNDPLPSLATHNPALPPALDHVLAQATAKNLAERYPNVSTLVEDFRQIVTSAGSISTPSITETWVRDLSNPYKGLRAFGEADADDFFGRNSSVQALLGRLSDSNDLARFLAVVGPSGSGKSSVVKAGLIPALRRGGLPGSERWFIVEMMPGPHPLEELEAALLRIAINPPESLLSQLREDERGLLRAVARVLPADPAIELVLVIDQFEELFTLVADEAARAHFLDSLVTAVLDSRSRLRLIITMRADFTDRPLQYVDFGELLRQRTEFILPLSPDELNEAITQPAARLGLILEPGLAAQIIHDVGREPGTLPLLQYALTELFERREGRTLSRATYQASGGVLGALTRRADEIYNQLDPQSQELARQLFLRLVTLGEGTDDTRRRVLRQELRDLEEIEGTEGEKIQNLKSEIQNPNDQGPMTMDKIIDLFGRYRLLTFDRDPITREPTVEVAHEALLREWGRLREWLDASRNDIRMQRLLANAAAEWRGAQQDSSFLLRGTRLDQFAGWAAGTTLAMTPEERTFLEASLADREIRQAEEAARQQRELETAQKLAETESQRAKAQGRAAQRLRWLAIGLTLFLLVAAGLAIYAFNQQSQAVNNLALSESQRLAAEANTILQGGGNTELAALLSLRALNTAYTAQADVALQQASTGDYGRRLFLGHTAPVFDLAFSPDGRLALSGSADASARLWDIQTGQELQTLTGHTSRIVSVAFSPDGQTVLTGSDDKTARLWDVQTGQELLVLTCPGVVGKAVFSPDGRYVVTASFDGAVQLWDVQQKGREVGRFNDAEGIIALAISSDGQSVLTGNVLTYELRLWAATTGQEVGRFTGATAGVRNVAFSPDGRYILSSDSDGGIRRWDLRQPQAESFLFIDGAGEAKDIEVSPDGRYALSASEDNTARLWDMETGQEVHRFVNNGGLTSIAFSPDSQMVLTGADDGTIRLWDLQPSPDPRAFSGHTDDVLAVEFSADGHSVLTSSADRTARLWDVETGRELQRFKGHTQRVVAVTFSPDGRYALTAGFTDGTARLWDLKTGQEVRVLPQPRGVSDADFSPDGRYILTSGFTIAQLWDAQTGQVVHTFTGVSAGLVAAVTFSPDGKYFLSGSWIDNAARLWEVETGQELRQIPEYEGNNNSLAFSRDGKYFLTGASENSAQLWEVETEQALGRFSGENVTFSRDGKYLVTGGLKTAYLWDRATGRQLRAFGGDHSVVAVAISPDNQFVLVAGSDKVPRLWDTDYHKLVDSVCARVLRDFTEKEREQYGIKDQAPTCPAKR